MSHPCGFCSPAPDPATLEERANRVILWLCYVRAGIESVRCSQCGEWRYPWELPAPDLAPTGKRWSWVPHRGMWKLSTADRIIGFLAKNTAGWAAIIPISGPFPTNFDSFEGGTLESGARLLAAEPDEDLPPPWEDPSH